VSSFVVDTVHMDVILAGCMHGPRDSTSWEGVSWAAGEELRRLTVLNVDRIGRSLMEENVASVCWADTPTQPPSILDLHADPAPRPGADRYGWALEYTFAEPGYTPTCAELAKALRCYRYQAGDHPGYPRSEACAFVEAALLTVLYSLPGDEEAPWEWTADIAAARADIERQAFLTNRRPDDTVEVSRVAPTKEVQL
jgi:hypothetical protein